MTVFGAIILAAGESSRMGQAKQLLRFGTSSLLDLALSSVSLPEVSERALVLGARAERIRQDLWADDFEIFENTNWQTGMITSVQCGVSALATRCDWIVLLPCDYALVKRDTVARMLLRASLSPETPIVAPSYLGRSGHPIVLGKETFDPILSLDTSLGLDTVVQAFRPERILVEVSDPAVHFDIDTPQDYERGLAYWTRVKEAREEALRDLSGESDSAARKAQS